MIEIDTKPSVLFFTGSSIIALLGFTITINHITFLYLREGYVVHGEKCGR